MRLNVALDVRRMWWLTLIAMMGLSMAMAALGFAKPPKSGSCEVIILGMCGVA